MGSCCGKHHTRPAPPAPGANGRRTVVENVAFHRGRAEGAPPRLRAAKQPHHPPSQRQQQPPRKKGGGNKGKPKRNSSSTPPPRQQQPSSGGSSRRSAQQQQRNPAKQPHHSPSQRQQTQPPRKKGGGKGERNKGNPKRNPSSAPTPRKQQHHLAVPRVKQRVLSSTDLARKCAGLGLGASYAKLRKEHPHAPDTVLNMIIKINKKKPMFSAEVDFAKTSKGGATDRVLQIAREQLQAACGACYSSVVSLRKMWAENEGAGGALPAVFDFTFQGKGRQRSSIYPKLFEAESNLTSILHVFINEWKLLETNSSTATTITAEAFAKLRVAGDEPGMPTMLSVIGLSVFEYHVATTAQPADDGQDVKNPWFTSNTAPPALAPLIEIYYSARNEIVTGLVPSILNDVDLYDTEAEAQVAAAGPLVMARIAQVAKKSGPVWFKDTDEDDWVIFVNQVTGEECEAEVDIMTPNPALKTLSPPLGTAMQRTAEDPDVPLTLERIAALTKPRSSNAYGGDDAQVPGSKTLARLSYDQMEACDGSVALYKSISKAVGDVKSQLSAPGEVMPGDVKKKERTIYKSGLKYGGDTTKCHDKVRCTVKLATLKDIAVVAEALQKLPDFVILRVKNRFGHDFDSLSCGGYRDVQLSGLIKLHNGKYVWCEVQLNLTRMLELKSGKAVDQQQQHAAGGGGGKSGHAGFDLARTINAFTPETCVHVGAWSSAVALQASAGLLYEIVLVDTNFADGAQRFEFVDALGSAQCRVRTLHMGGMTPDLGCEGGATVGKMLAANTSVTNIELQYSGLGDVGGTALAKGLKVNTALTSINLDNNALGEAGGTALAAALKVNTTLISICLGDNALGAVACTALAAALKVNTTLTYIGLGGNALGEAGGTALAKALKTNTALTQINLSCTALGEAGGTALAAALKVNTTLTTIILYSNKLGDVAGTALAAALKVNTTLTYIHLGDNALGAVACTALAAALKSNTTLTDIVEFDGNAIPDATTQAIRAAVAKNKEAAK